MTRRAREAIKLLDRAGAAAIEYLGRAESQHLRFRVRAGNGAQQTFFMSSTPSDHRGDLNKVAKVRRFCRENQK